MPENKNIPALRFPGFIDPWEEKVLGEIATFSKGKNISKSDITDDGAFECIRYGELYTEYGEVIKDIKSKTNLPVSDLIFSEYNDVIIPASGETQIDIAKASCVLKDKVALGGDLNIIKSRENGIVLAYYLNSKKKLEIASLAQGNSVVHLYASQLKKLKLKLPSLQEQQKTANFLTAIDECLQQLQQKQNFLEKYKRGCMQQIFNRQLRFTDANGRSYGDWEEKAIGQIGTSYSGLTNKSGNDFGKGKPYIQYKQIFDNSRINVSKFQFVNIAKGESQNKVHYGDILFTISSETPKEVGMSSVLLDEVDELYLNSFSFGYRPNSLDELNPVFASFLFRSKQVRLKIEKLAQGSTRYNISKNELMKLKIKLPSSGEQKKIAGFLSAIDSQIELVQQQSNLIQQCKKALLQQMFI